MSKASSFRSGILKPLRPKLNAHWDQSLGDEDMRLLHRGLNAQARMLPYVLLFFALGLPVYLYALAVFETPVVLFVSVVLFAINWGLFYHFNSRIEALRERAEAEPETRARRIKQIFWRQALCAALWPVTLTLVSLLAIGRGEAAHPFLFVCAGAAVGICFFTSPVLMFLLTLGPLACVGPMVAMQIIPTQSPDARGFVTGAMALGLLMGFILNRHLIEHYKLEEDQVRLYRERESALEASRALGETKMALIETLSREVLTGLKGLEAHLKRAGGLLARAPAPRSHVDSALYETRHLQSVIASTLDNDTATSGLLEIDVQPLNLKGLLRDLESHFAPEAALKGLEFSLKLHPLPAKGAAMGDMVRVQQILSHLIGNAIAYTQKGRVELILSGVVGGRARIQVVDSGPGLEPAEMERAFRPYQRVARTSSGVPGAGLGLSLSRALSGLMGAETGAESTPDVGSKFWLDLPFDAEAEAVVDDDEDDAPASNAETPGMRVLLIASDSLTAAEVRDALEQGGHRCLTATTPARALSLAGKAEIDACVMAADPMVGDDALAKVEAFAKALRRTQTAGMASAPRIVALLTEGAHAEDLQALGIEPVLWPLGSDGLNRALAA